MKTTKIFQTALAAGMVCFATLANAQANYEYVAYGTTGKTADDVAATQVDFVTVGAKMPYSVDTAQTHLATWLTGLTTAGITGVTAVTHVNWTVNGTALAGSYDEPEIGVQWNTQGDYTLKAHTSIAVAVNGTPIAGTCSSHEEEKLVYVLPEPTAAFTATTSVLACNVTTHTVNYKATGIGQKQVAYTITRKPYSGTVGAPEVGTPQVISTGVTTGGIFQNDVIYANATNTHYNIATAAGESITVNGLENGFIYTVEITSLSDQISRKSGVTVTLPSTAKVSFAVVPEAVGTKIDHVKNVVEP